jgi:hypothetical protein
MKARYDKRSGNCAVCALWSGNREVDRVGHYLDANPTERARCLCQGGPLQFSNPSAISSCNKWQPFGALR